MYKNRNPVLIFFWCDTVIDRCIITVNLLFSESDCSVTERLFTLLETDSRVQEPIRGDCG